MIGSGDVLSDEKSKCNSFMHKMVNQLNVFITSMKHQIYCHMKSSYVVAVENWSRCQSNVKIFKDEHHPCEFSCCVCYGLILHFSAGPRDDMLLFAHHEMRFPPRNVQYPVVERLVVGHLTQSALERAQGSFLYWPVVKCKPMFIVPSEIKPWKKAFFTSS